MFNDDNNPVHMSSCVYSLCFMQRLLAARQGTSLQHNIQQVLDVELTDPRPPLHNWCLRSLGMVVGACDGSPEWTQWAMDWLNKELVREEEKSVEAVQNVSVWLSVVTTLVETCSGELLMMMKNHYTLLLAYVRSVSMSV